MPALKQTPMQADSRATPPVKHRAILTPRGPADALRVAGAAATPITAETLLRAKEIMDENYKRPAPPFQLIKTERIPHG